MKNHLPLTYTGSNTDNLYVSGWKNGKAIKLRVKELNCHSGIIAEGIIQDHTTYTHIDELKAALENDELEESTVYIVTDDKGNKKEYLYYNDQLTPLGISENETIVSGGLEFGSSFESFEKLLEAKNNNLLNSKKIYTVDDIGTIEQYILYKGELKQIAGAVNEIITGSIANESEVSTAKEDEDGIIDYNLIELKNGNYRYKNHTSLKEVYCDMPNLISGIQMFYGTSLEHFCGNLGSLEDGTHMFSKGCKLDEESIINIVDSLKKTTNGHIDIGYNSILSNSFLENMKNELNLKGWSVRWYRDGAMHI